MSVFGLRARFVAALLGTSVVALLVTAAGLLPGLQARLRDEQVQETAELARVSAPALRRLDVRALRPGSRELLHVAVVIARRTAGRVVVSDARGRRLADSHPQILRLRRAAAATPAPGGALHVSVPVMTRGGRVVLDIRRPVRDVAATYALVRDAFVNGALVALLAALVLGAALTWRLLRRLRRLKDAGTRLATDGLGVPVPEDRGRDELGDLARTLDLMRQRLHAEEESRRRFLSTASHELRTPLASLSGTLELAEDDLRAEPPDVGDALDRVLDARRQGRRLVQLAVDLLDITRLESHETGIRREAVELHEIARAVTAEFETRAAAAGVPIVVEAGDEPCWALGDPGWVARVTRILLDNALRFAPPGEPLTVQVHRDGDRAVLAVTDSGPGVPPEDRERIFERFERGSLTGGARGFGLGLAIGRQLAQRMQGTLELVDVARGARFELRLPRPS